MENFDWAFVGVYGPNDDGKRRGLWDELAGSMNIWKLPWCMGGNFNIVRSPCERGGEARSSQAMEDFFDFIFEQGLIDIPMVGGRSTWSNFHAWSKIDRFLPSTKWEEKFPKASQRHLSRLLSDHYPLLLDCGVGRQSRGSFKFENMWLQAEGFEEQVKRWWGSYIYEGKPSYVFARKLKALKVDLKKWNEEVFGNVGVQKKEMKKGLSELDMIAEERPLSEEENIKREDYSRSLERSTYLEKVSLRQKSMVLRLKEGDNNTKFFHRLANSHRRHNLIEILVVDGHLTDETTVIQDHIVDFYKKLYCERYQWILKADDLSFLSIDDGERIWIEREFEEDEILEVVRNFKGNKALGPDEFTMTFFQKCWEVLKVDIIEVLKEFHNSGKFEKSLHATFVLLIPKKVGAVEIEDFRPISLIGGMYKIIAKVLANKLKSVLGKIVSHSLFLISNFILSKSAEGHNPNTRGVYKSAPKKNKQRINLKSLQKVRTFKE